MNLKDVYGYYSNEKLRDFIVSFSKDREVTGVFRNGNFSQRPNVILYPNDILAMVKTGVVEFHCSLERWSQPMSLVSENYDKLRIGWDLILDVDCKLFEHGKIASEAFIWGLKKHGISNVFLKFTGGTGFHIGIPWESFPEKVDYKPTEKQYPELARKMVFYLKEFVKERFESKVLKKFSAEDLSKQVNKPLGKILTDEGIEPYEVVDVDPILISPRHFFRLPYSINRKTFLVSLPIKSDELEDFKKMDAKPEKVKFKEGFLNRHKKEEADTLVLESSDWWAMKSADEKHEIINEQLEKLRRIGYRWIDQEDLKKFKVMGPEGRRKIFIPEKLFPPCIKNISKGLTDGKKRSLFTILNFLRSSNWNWEDIEKFVNEWNKKNNPPLRENYIRSQLRWHRARGKQILPPNCLHPGWYEDFGVCKPDTICGGKEKTVKNPVNYAVRTIKKRKGYKK
ncbi:MAG: hypothetical protein GTN76_06620 [Candidatus Aenigmarchaeota archaeon]|nr:hypothetical protein [Candidatus Aenigmarchaeota archaeon]